MSKREHSHFTTGSLASSVHAAIALALGGSMAKAEFHLARRDVRSLALAQSLRASQVPAIIDRMQPYPTEPSGTPCDADYQGGDSSSALRQVRV